MSKRAFDIIMAGLKDALACARGDHSRQIALDLGDTVRPRAKGERYSLEELLDRVTPENRHAEVDWGEAQGKEDW